MVPMQTGLLPELGKHKTGAACLYVNKLDDVDRDVLAEMIRTGYKHVMEELHTSLIPADSKRPPPPESGSGGLRCSQGLLACNDLEVDDSRNILVQANVGRVRTDRLDVVRQFNVALVDGAEASGLNSSSDISRLDGAEETTGLAGLHLELDLLGGQSLGLCLCSFNRSVRTSGAGSLDGLNLLLATLGPGQSEAAGQQEVTCVTVLDLDDIASSTETGYFVGQNELCHVS